MEWSREATRALRFLAGCPSGSTCLEANDLRSLLLNTGGTMLACGSLYNINTKDLGVGVYRITLSLANP